MNEAEEIAKAIQETAKLGEKGLEAAEKVGGFIAKVFKEPIAEFSGLITDKIRFVRLKRMVQMSDEVNQILLKRGVNETKAVSPKIALPIFENASLEDDENIQTLWNHLLANAMNPQFNDEVRYGFIEMIKNITGIEAQLLNNFYEEVCELYGILREDDQIIPLEEVHTYSLKKEWFIQKLGLSNDQYAVAANNLMRMQLIGPAILTGSARMSVGTSMEPVTIYKGVDEINLTPLGIKFVEACIK